MWRWWCRRGLQLDRGVESLEKDVNNAVTMNDDAFVDAMSPLLRSAKAQVRRRALAALICAHV